MWRTLRLFDEEGPTHSPGCGSPTQPIAATDRLINKKTELGRPQAAQPGILWRILHGRDDTRG